MAIGQELYERSSTIVDLRLGALKFHLRPQLHDPWPFAQ